MSIDGITLSNEEIRENARRAADLHLTGQLEPGHQ